MSCRLSKAFWPRDDGSLLQVTKVSQARLAWSEWQGQPQHLRRGFCCGLEGGAVQGTRLQARLQRRLDCRQCQPMRLRIKSRLRGSSLTHCCRLHCNLCTAACHKSNLRTCFCSSLLGACLSRFGPAPNVPCLSGRAGPSGIAIGASGRLASRAASPGTAASATPLEATPTAAPAPSRPLGSSCISGSLAAAALADGCLVC